MMACSNRMPKCFIIGMHTVCCVTHTEASIVQAVWLADCGMVESVNILQILSCLLLYKIIYFIDASVAKHNQH